MLLMRRRPLVPGSWSLVALLLLACSSRPKADFVLFGKIWTGDSSLPYAQALAVAHDSILAVGDSASIARLAGSRTELIVNRAGLVVPGFWDDHVHFLQGGAHVAGVQLRDAATPAEFVRRIKEYAAGL